MEDSNLRNDVTIFMKKHIDGTDLTDGDIDDAMVYVNERLDDFLETYAFSAFSPLEMCVISYIQDCFIFS